MTTRERFQPDAVHAKVVPQCLHAVRRITHVAGMTGEVL